MKLRYKMSIKFIVIDTIVLLIIYSLSLDNTGFLLGWLTTQFVSIPLMLLPFPFVDGFSSNNEILFMSFLGIITWGVVGFIVGFIIEIKKGK